MADIAIHTDNLTRHFGPVKAVDGLTFAVPAGSVFGFLGPNGSGKTTTIRLLLGLLEPTGGRAEVLGLDVRTQASEIRAQAGVVLDQHGLYEQMSALDNLDFWGRAWHLPRRERRTRIQEALERCGLWERRHDRVGSWSHGMKKRLAVARALLTRPKILLLDEPTAGLDVISAAALRQDLIDLVREHGITVFLSTHNMSEAEQLCTQVAVIRSGRLVTIGSPDRLRTQAGRRCVEFIGRGFAPKLRELLKNHPAVTAVNGDGSHLFVELNEGAETAPLVSLLVQEGAALEEVRRSVASLEEVFLALMDESEEEEQEEEEEV